VTDSLGLAVAPGRLPEHILQFARALRAAGLPVGPGRVLGAIRAAETVGLANKEDFYWALNAALVSRRDHQELFDQAFHVFWRNPQLLQRLLGLLLPEIKVDRRADKDMKELSRRLAEALKGRSGGEDEREREEETPELELDASMTFSAREILQKRDFERMSADELADAKRALAAMRLPVRDVPTRRFRPDPRGRRADMRASLRAALRQGGDIIPLVWKSRRRRPPPLVVLCDISGSMAQYSRMLLHFLHAVTNDRDRVHSFLFATRLTNVTRFLRHRDVDVAVDKITEAVADWSGGTRIGDCLRDFNRIWSRRVLGQGAVVLVITDGLDRRGAWGVAREMERLHKSCRRLIWLNPLLRYDAYAPKTLGARAILPHVDEVRSVHNLESLSDLAAALGASGVCRPGQASTLMENQR
jgi:uncharacterized protein with von Willebrand factor type A (vWA) domain